eukprot:gene7303-14893_t
MEKKCTSTYYYKNNNNNYRDNDNDNNYNYNHHGVGSSGVNGGDNNIEGNATTVKLASSGRGGRWGRGRGRGGGRGRGRGGRGREGGRGGRGRGRGRGSRGGRGRGRGHGRGDGSHNHNLLSGDRSGLPEEAYGSTDMKKGRGRPSLSSTSPKGTAVERGGIQTASVRVRTLSEGGDENDNDESEQSEDDGESDAEDVDMGMTDTYLSSQSLAAALAGAGVCCRAVDTVICNGGNAFACVRPPGHHAGRNGSTVGCLSTGFCLLNNAAISLVYARVRWGLEKVAVVDIDVHFGNGTAELLRDDPRAFFASVHMVYGDANKGTAADSSGFYPGNLGVDECSANYVSVGVLPAFRKQNKNTATTEEEKLHGPEGFRRALSQSIIPALLKFDPELLIISAGFDGYHSDPLGNELNLTTDDYIWATKQLMKAMSSESCAGKGRIVSLLEGGYDTDPTTLGLATCVNAHIYSFASHLEKPQVHTTFLLFFAVASRGITPESTAAHALECKSHQGSRNLKAKAAEHHSISFAVRVTILENESDDQLIEFTNE